MEIEALGYMSFEVDEFMEENSWDVTENCFMLIIAIHQCETISKAPNIM